MPTAAFIAARKALLAELLAAHVNWRDGVINPAIAKLNAAITAGDTALTSVAGVLTPAVLKINLYRPELDKAIAATNAMVPDPVIIPPPSSDWATKSAGRKLALRLMSPGPEDVNLAGRHPRDPRGIWTDGANRPLPVIDDKGLRFDIVSGAGVPDWYTDLGARYGANSKMYAQWQMMFSKTFVETVFLKAGGGFPGIKLAVFSSITGTSDSQKIVVSTLDQWNLVYLYQYYNGNTVNLDESLPGDFDFQPRIGLPAQCLYSVYTKTPRGVTPAGCRGLVPDKWITFDLIVETGDLIPGTGAWDADRKLYMTVDGKRDLIIHWGKDTHGYLGRMAGPYEAIWLAPYMTGKDPAQVHPVASVWHRELIVDDKPIFTEPPIIVIPPPVTPSTQPPGTFAEFSKNTPYSAHPPTLPDLDGTKRIFTNWNSGTLVRDYSPKGGIAYHGGGEHGTGAEDSCGVLVLNLDTRLYEFKCRASKPMIQSSGQAIETDPTNDFGEHADGSPGAPHTYNQLVEMTKAQGGGPRGSMMRLGGTAGGSTTAGARAKARLDAGTITQAQWVQETAAAGNAKNCGHSFDLSKDVLGVTRFTQGIDYGLAPNATNGNYAAACRRGDIGWVAKMGGDHAIAMIALDGSVTYSPIKLATVYPSVAHWSNNGQDVMMIMYLGSPRDYMVLVNLKTWEVKNVKPVGVPPGIDTAGINCYVPYLGMKWSSSLNCLAGFNNYEKTVPTAAYLKPSNPDDIMGSTWVWSAQTFTSFGGAQIDIANDDCSKNGSWGRFIETVDGFVWSRGASQKALVFRPLV